jgi:hypothetical protein
VIVPVLLTDARLLDALHHDDRFRDALAIYSADQGLHVIVTTGLAQMRVQEWHVGQALKLIRDRAAYRTEECGGPFDYFDEYLAQPDVDIAPPTARRYITAVETWAPLVAAGRVTTEQLEDMGTTKGAMLQPTLQAHPDDAEEWAEKGARLSKNDLKKEMRRADPDQPFSNDALTYLEETSAKIIGLAARLPDSREPTGAFDVLARVVAEARTAWSTGEYA